MNEAAESIGGAGLIAFHILASRPLRRWRTGWGATASEIAETLPGDEFVPNAAWSYTHAITVDSAADQLWPSLIQIGQQRAGFYSYRGLENMVGCNITSAAGINHDFQLLEVGDKVALHPKSPPLTVTMIKRGTTMVLLGEGPDIADHALWSFHLRPITSDRTRLIERGRYSHGRSVASRLAFGCSIIEPIGFVMSRKMLHTLRANAEAMPR
ncbi:hypothetical protein [Rhodococcus sp. AQ5-07]|uniref:hypothetical protein n=1 Tax=Rhodococcus sp. AQ5-07 TaxID=2054902 RepID=UPI000DC00B15|nr:hypothetical protein [Rhodococcus sp. AQ5-07]RAL31625.1 hypothetical protein CVN56_25975 [Rhodococcus sp. AQ5-07]